MSIECSDSMCFIADRYIPISKPGFANITGSHDESLIYCG